MGKCEAFKKPDPDSQNLKNECTLCWTIGIFKRVLHCESEGKYGMEQKSGVSLDTAGEGRRLGCGNSRHKKQRTRKPVRSSHCLDKSTQATTPERCIQTTFSFVCNICNHCRKTFSM